MNPQDPEEYIRKLERGGQTPGATPQPSSTNSRSGSPFPASPPPPGWTVASPRRAYLAGEILRRFPGVAKLANTPPGRLILVCAVTFTFAIGFGIFMAHYAGKTTVHGNVVMINSGAKETIDCNNGNVKLDGDNNTYTITGHCRRLEVFGSANHVTADSADIISVFGDDNVMIYHSGSPTINKTGNNNTVSQRSSVR